jgi:hypothetical protein
LYNDLEQVSVGGDVFAGEDFFYTDDTAVAEGADGGGKGCAAAFVGCQRDFAVGLGGEPVWVYDGRVGIGGAAEGEVAAAGGGDEEDP